VSGGADPVRPLPTGRRHVDHLARALPSLDVDRLTGWGRELAGLLAAGMIVLAATLLFVRHPQMGEIERP
jgi:hypothetical protein